MKYYLKQLFCIHDFCYLPTILLNRKHRKKYDYIDNNLVWRNAVYKYDYIDNNLVWRNAVYVYQVIGKCLKCDKEKIYKEYFGDDDSLENSIKTAKTLNNFRELKNNQSN